MALNVVPMALDKILAGTVTASLRFAFEVAPDYIKAGRELVGTDGMWYVLIGPFPDEESRRKIENALAEAAGITLRPDDEEERADTTPE